MVVDSDTIETVAVVGSEQIGRGIAAILALSGYETAVNDIVIHFVAGLVAPT
ncbi:hypothetical protein [Natrinema halophilum]|uniref:hypothetical protein n=1 Tax=Natrinema halophilum TaxID=1699371 RepID=UPI001F358658|nr:hypothetical protein [Natrinema halophilum]UHQ96124.1 hypothetical protein HYG82_22645 [Natrinema halophilum]